jgi:acetolactate synthase-1/2/3 large subunit
MSSSTDQPTDPTAPARTATDAAVEALAASGVDHVFGLPGTTIMGLLDVLGRHDGLRYLSVRHEQAAAHMADGFWRASGRVAACLASRGPGAANLTIGLHNAYAESIPLLAIVGQVPDALAHREAFEEMDLLGLFRPVTKWSAEVHDAERVGELVHRAARTATTGRPRPTFVSLPLDVLQAPVRGGPVTVSATPSAPAPAPEAVAAAAAVLRAARRPVIVAGGGMLRPAWCTALVETAEYLQAPVVTTWMRKNAYPNDHPLYAGTLGYGAHPAAERAVAEADVLLALGCRFSEFTTKRYQLVAPGTAIVQVDVDADEIGAVYPVTQGVTADAWEFCRQLADALSEHRAPDAVRDRAGRLRHEAVTESEPPTTAPDHPGGVPSAELVAALRRVVARHDPIVVQDTHSFGPWLARYLDLHRPGTHYGAAGGAMGWGFPAALGIQAARPDERVVAVCGDGSFWMVAQELETAVRERLPVVTVVTNNFAYGNTRDRQTHAHGGRYVGVFYDNPDFAEFARLCGAHGERVEHPDQLDAALERALASGRPAVVDVIQHRHEGLPGDLQPLPAR